MKFAAVLEVLLLNLTICSASDPDCDNREGFRPDDYSLYLDQGRSKASAREFCNKHDMALASMEEEEQFNATRYVMELCELLYVATGLQGCTDILLSCFL